MTRTYFFLPLIILFLIVISSHSQGYQIEHELTLPSSDPGFYSTIQIPNIRQRRILNGTGQAYGTINGINNENYYDMENDGIPEILHMRYSESGTEIQIYNGSTLQLKKTIVIDSFKIAGDEQGNLAGFLDIDGDGKKEIVGEFLFHPDPQNALKGGYNKIIFIDAQSGTIEYSIPSYYSSLSPDGYDGYAIYDIDNDSYPEVICRWHTDDGTIKLRIYGNTPSEIGKRNSKLAKANSVNLKNFPNPFFNSTRIEYYVSSADKVTLKIFNSEGKFLRLLVNKQQPIGEYIITWDGKNDNRIKMAPGQYYYQIKIGEFISTKRMISLN